MSEEIKEELKVEEPKRFTINVGDEKKPEALFKFSGPERAPLGLIYDAAYTVLSHISSSIQERAESLKPKSEEDLKAEEDKKEESK